ncbi:hypothetical protein CC86DRAFT_388915 [Ophiobolus disseminans]|uniref:Uncharacterized protein n=1 Tax=Ophiobolus disseminans TaxID=1469910 RepID=A0A6A6ZC62_9PLEO|nr:hypothetical protein CC86DRAFT_388915 [Ophiobolus disseminans]
MPVSGRGDRPQLPLESQQALFTRNRPRFTQRNAASVALPARCVVFVRLDHLGLFNTIRAAGLGQLLGRSSTGVPPGRVHCTVGCIPAFIDQATKPVEASPFVMAARAGRDQTHSKDSSRLCGSESDLPITPHTESRCVSLPISKVPPPCIKTFLFTSVNSIATSQPTTTPLTTSRTHINHSFKMRFSIIATTVLAAGVGAQDLSSIVNQIPAVSSLLGQASSLLNAPASALSSVAGGQASAISSARSAANSAISSAVAGVSSRVASANSSANAVQSSVSADVASRLSSLSQALASATDPAARSSVLAAESSVRASATRVVSSAASAASGAASTGAAAQPTALAGMGAIAGGLLAMAGLL